MGTKHIKKEDLHLGDQIGSGGFSTVFKSTLNGQEVAVKKLNKSDKREIEILETLDHPHIVKSIGALEENSNLYLVLELCKGGSLRSYLDRKRFENKLLPIYQVYDWAKQAVKPIQYLHARKLVHKDIKTANFLIADGNILKLADFGITKNIECTIQNATQSGTAAYGAPELLKDFILSPSYDVSAYGVVVWELCTTLVPFEGSSRDHIIWRICHDNERPPIPANCPEPLADLMSKCWEVDWKKRPHPNEILQHLRLAEKQAFKTFIAGPWKCEKVLGQQELGKPITPNGIAINPTNQDAVVVEMDLGKLVVYSRTGEFKFIIGTPIPWNVAVSNDGNYYITNGTQFVHQYNQSGIDKKWVAVSTDNEPLDRDTDGISGLAIDHTSNLLLVAVPNYKCISKHDLDGTHVNSIKVNIIPNELSVTTQGTIIITGLFEAQIVDQTGKMLHILKPSSYLQKSRWCPQGVCCHEGIIFICNYTPQQIACFTEHGDYLGSIPVDLKPIDITFVPEQNKCYIISSLTDKNRSSTDRCIFALTKS